MMIPEEKLVSSREGGGPPGLSYCLHERLQQLAAKQGQLRRHLMTGVVHARAVAGRGRERDFWMSRREHSFTSPRDVRSRASPRARVSFITREPQFAHNLRVTIKFPISTGTEGGGRRGARKNADARGGSVAPRRDVAFVIKETCRGNGGQWCTTTTDEKKNNRRSCS